MENSIGNFLLTCTVHVEEGPEHIEATSRPEAF